MKKLILFLILAFFTLSACGEGQPDSATDPEPVQTDNDSSATTPPPGEIESPDPETQLPEDEPPEIPDFALQYGDFLIEMDQNSNYVLNALGEPQGTFVMPSCAFEGKEDRIYQYPGIEIFTYPKDNDYFVHTISFSDDSIRTTEGKIYLGSSLQAVLDAYGDDYEYENGMYKYTRGLTNLEFFIEEDIVMNITYSLTIQQQ